MPLRGNFFVNIFSHYRVKGPSRWWLPPTPPTDTTLSDASADDTIHDESIRCLNVETENPLCIDFTPDALDRRVSFSLYNAGTRTLYTLWAIPGSGNQYRSQATILPGSSARINSFVGHNMFLRGACNDLIRVHVALEGKKVAACSSAGEHWLLEKEYPLETSRARASPSGDQD